MAHTYTTPTSPSRLRSHTRRPFGLAAFVDSATDDLTIELSFEAICIGFEAFAREGELYRTLAGAPMPCLQTCMGAIQLDGVTEMRTAQSTDEAVEARVDTLLQARGLLPASAGQKRLADGSANDTAATTAAAAAAAATAAATAAAAN